MNTERLHIKAAVYVIVRQKNKVLFLRRYNTGWMDGKFTVPSGHVDKGEMPIDCAKRELKEESNIDVAISDLKCVHVMYRKDKYVDFYYEAINWLGQEKLNEPEKADDLQWLEINDDRIIKGVRSALQSIKKKKFFSQYATQD